MAKLRVLMIDDSEMALEVQVMMLERQGCEVCACMTLEEMVEASKSFVPDVVVTDVGLGEISVQESCATIRASFGDTVPVLLFSGREDHELEALVVELGVDGFINKADDRQTVIQKLTAASAVK